jgi:hypothetical protein
MSRVRRIDPEVWHHPFFQREPWWVRDLFMYLFSCASDDEGRFHADPLAILSEAFPRRYPVTEEDVAAGLQASTTPVWCYSTPKAPVAS